MNLAKGLGDGKFPNSQVCLFSRRYGNSIWGVFLRALDFPGVLMGDSLLY